MAVPPNLEIWFIEVKLRVLSRGGRYQTVKEKDEKGTSPLDVKEVRVDDRRYIVCYNEDQSTKDRADRNTILNSLQDKLKQGGKSLVGNKGYRKYLKTCGNKKAFEIDKKKVAFESRFDGKWVLRTNTNLPGDEVALKYKDLWMVERIFRSMKSLLETRPIYHRCDTTIRGHVFCSFLALILIKKLNEKLSAKGFSIEWNEIKRNLANMQEVKSKTNNKVFALTINKTGICRKIFQAVGVAIPPTIQNIDSI